MKKLLNFLLILVAIVLLIGVSGFLFIEIKGIPSYEAKKIDYKVELTPARVERGKKLALLLCANCHKNSTTDKLSGTQLLDAPPQFGKIFSANITNDKTSGIGSWTDGELLYFFRTGIKRTGKYAPEYMVKLPHMADEDLNSVIAFLRSDDALVTADPSPTVPCEPAFLTKFLCTVAWKPLPMPEQPIPLPDTNNPVALGKYLVYNLTCYPCHSADFKTTNVMEPEKSVGYMGGGNKPLNKDGRVVVTQNLTPDNETGIGNWSEEKFVNALKYGIVENQPALRYPMVPFAQLTDAEAKAIYAYLRTIPAIANKVPRSDL